MGKVIWYTGLPCSGKTTNALALIKALEEDGRRVEHLDGDVIRGTPLAQDVGFSPDDRAKHIKRMGQLAKMFSRHAFVVCSFVSPSEEVRQYIKDEIGKDFIEVYMKASIDHMIERDTKGMYAKAIVGEIDDFTGINAPYDVPKFPDVICDGVNNGVETNVNKVLQHLGHLDISRLIKLLI